jgi:hypothetical protein
LQQGRLEVTCNLKRDQILITLALSSSDRFCDLVVRVPGYTSRGPGFDFWHYEIFRKVGGLEGKVAAPV